MRQVEFFESKEVRIGLLGMIKCLKTIHSFTFRRSNKQPIIIIILIPYPSSGTCLFSSFKLSSIVESELELLGNKSFSHKMYGVKVKNELRNI
jgi:hypothetical protein